MDDEVRQLWNVELDIFEYSSLVGKLAAQDEKVSTEIQRKSTVIGLT